MTSATVLQLTSDDFRREVIESGRPVLVDFWAGWCQPCHAVAPIVEQLAGEYAGRITVAKVDTDASPELSREYSIGSIPTLLLFHDGEIVERFVGVRSREEYAAALDAVLG